MKVSPGFVSTPGRRYDQAEFDRAIVNVAADSPLTFGLGPCMIIGQP
jgi:hypothetical protein